MICPGGYQIIDFTGVSLSRTQAVTVSDSKNAEILRNTRKPVWFSGASLDAVTVSGWMSTIADTGARDGKVYQAVIANITFAISTDDNNITITPTDG